MADQIDQPPTSATTAATAAKPASRRRWPRRLLYALALLATVLVSAFWLLGREASLQPLLQRLASASGGHVSVSGVSGSLYHRLHIGQLVVRSADSVITADQIDINWSPLQYFSEGLSVSALHVAALTVHSTGPSTPTPMPASLAAPFHIRLSDVQIDKLTVSNSNGSAPEVIEQLHFALVGDRQHWQLQHASAATAYGKVKAELSIDGRRPFALQGTASLVQAGAGAGAGATTASSQVKSQATGQVTDQVAGQVTLKAGGNLALLTLSAQASAGGATANASATVTPFDAFPLRTLELHGRNLDPSTFQAGWPQANLSLDLGAAIKADHALSGQFTLHNQGQVGPLDQQALPLKTISAKLAGTLTAATLEQVLIDLGGAGRLTGAGQVQRSGIDAGIDNAHFTVNTERLDLHQLHRSLRPTSAAGQLALSATPTRQTLSATLGQPGLRLDLQATLADAVLQLQQARLQAGQGRLSATAEFHLKHEQAVRASVRAEHFDPALLAPGLPAADINAELTAHGQLAPSWQLAANLGLKTSRLAGQPLSGLASFRADAHHVSSITAQLALARNNLAIEGAFGAPGEQLRWKLTAPQLSAVAADLSGAIHASGSVSGTLQAPHASFEVDATALALKPFKPAAGASDSLIHASGELAWIKLAGPRSAPELTINGQLRHLNPTAFGAAQAGDLNATYTAQARLASDWRASVNLMLQPSTLANAPLSGYAKLSADQRGSASADLDLRLAGNQLQALGSVGSTLEPSAQPLNWQLRAPQLAALGVQFGGTLQASGSIAGSRERPALTLQLAGANLRLPGQQQIGTLRGSATLGSTTLGSTASVAGQSRRASAEPDVPLVSDFQLSGYVSPALTLQQARLQTSGTRSRHTLQLSASNADFDASIRAQGAWALDRWSGALETLQNRGRFALALAAPAPLSLSAAPGSGVVGLLHPTQITLGNAVIKLPDGSIRLDSLEKNAGLWTSKGQASGVPANYLAQLSDAWRASVRSSLTLGAEWGLRVQAGGEGKPPQLAGLLHVSREQGDLTVIGTDLTQPLELRALDGRIDVNDGTLRLALNLDSARTGQARIDASAQLLDGRLSERSAITLNGSASIASLAALAPLSGQPGLELGGTLNLAVSGAGTLGAPQLNGNLSGTQLMVNWVDQGIKLRNGQLQARLSGDQLLLQNLTFDGAEGHAQASGSLRYADNETSVNLQLSADQLEVLSRPDRILVISGRSTLVRDAHRFQLDGKFRADRANIELAGDNSPTLSDDVVIVGQRAAPTRAAQGQPLNIDIEADLGDAFKLKGKGLDAQLAGTLRIRVADRRPPRINGSIRVANGTYAAYGQQLAIERGVINFSGAYDNPGLSILAVRRRPEGEALSETNVEAGVEVRGSALAPVAKLVSTPVVSDSDKLAWLVLGHGIDNSGGNDMALLSAAAGALFGGGQGKLASALGVDELGVSQAAGAAAGSATGLQNTVVTVGKRLSSRAYLSFEQGAGTATSLVKLKYKLNPRITLQFQTGTNNALDLLYTWAFD